MGMSTHIYGFTPPDETWKKMKKVWDACEEAGITIPEEVYTFFGGTDPDPAGVETNIDGCYIRYTDEYRQGFEIHVAKIPKHIEVIRVLNSW